MTKVLVHYVLIGVFCICGMFVYAASDVKTAETAQEDDTAQAESIEAADLQQKKKEPQQEQKSSKKNKSETAPLPQNDTPDTSFAAICRNSLAVAEDNRWYYEHFDRFGRPVFSVLYEKDTQLEKTLWSYEGKARVPIGKAVHTANRMEEITYDKEGREVLIAVYGKKHTLLSKTENTYNSSGQLTEQILTRGNTVDKSVWTFAKDKVVSQTKYRNDKKTAFIELHSEKKIVHLYIDDKEVLVTEEP